MVFVNPDCLLRLASHDWNVVIFPRSQNYLKKSEIGKDFFFKNWIILPAGFRLVDD